MHFGAPSSLEYLQAAKFDIRQGDRPVYPTCDIDRDHSRLHDRHKWSDHPETLSITDAIYAAIGAASLEGTSNRKPRQPYKHQLREFIIDLFVSWLEDPDQSISFYRDTSRYRVNCRYNALHINNKLIALAALMEEHGYLYVLPGYHVDEDDGRSYVTRVRPIKSLIDVFLASTLDLDDITYNYEQETIVLRDVRDGKSKNVAYRDTAETDRMRAWLGRYNAMLSRHSIDIPECDRAAMSWTTYNKQGKVTRKTVPLFGNGKNAHRVFCRGSFELHGRFSGPFWTQIRKEDRRKIYIGDEPTVELDFSGLHPNMLSLKSKGVLLDADPYTLDRFPVPCVPREWRRDALKRLVLMAINAKDRPTACKAFRADIKDDEVMGSLAKLKNADLIQMMHAFIDRYPHLENDLCADRGISLMYEESCMAEEIMTHFMERDIPVLCIHDSFVIQERHKEELRQVMKDVSRRHLGAEVDIKCTDGIRQERTEGYKRRVMKWRISQAIAPKDTPRAVLTNGNSHIVEYPKVLTNPNIFI